MRNLSSHDGFMSFLFGMNVGIRVLFFSSVTESLLSRFNVFPVLQSSIKCCSLITAFVILFIGWERS